MIIKTEIISFDEFQAWSGGKDTLDELTHEQQERLFQYAEEVFPDGCTDTALNDWLWFDRDSIYEYLGIDSNGNDIGSTEWARPILMEYAEEKQFSVSRFGNVYNMLTCFLDEEYCDGDCDDEDDLKETFDTYVFDRWKEYAKQQLMAWHSDFGAELIADWLDENYDKEDEIPDIDDVEDSFKDYVDELNKIGEDE